MAELLVRTIDKNNPASPGLDAQCLKRGDVVAVGPDGHPWSALELSAPWWRVVRVPGATVTEMEARFLTAEEDADGKLVRRRVRTFDIDGYAKDRGVAIPAEGTAYERRSEPRAGARNADLPALTRAEAIGYARDR